MGRVKNAEKIPRILWIGFTVTFLVLATAGLVFYRSQERFLRREATITLDSIADLKAGQIVEWRNELLADAADYGATPYTVRLFREWLITPKPSVSSQILALFEVRRRNHDFLEIRLAGRDGRTVLSHPQKTEDVRPEVTEALEIAGRQRRPGLSRFFRDPDGRNTRIAVVAPIFASDASDSPLIGAMVSIVDPGTFLFPLIESWPTPSPSAETLLVTRDGDEALFLNELRHRKGTALKLRISLNKTEVPAAMAAQGREGVVEGLDYRGIPVLAVLKKIPDTPWFMVSKIDRAEAFAAWRTRGALIIALILALIASAAAAFLMLWQRKAKTHYRALHEAESARDLSEARYRTALISIGDGVIVTDLEGRVVFINPTAERLTGWSRREARALPLGNIFPIINEDTRLPVENPVERVLREGLVVGLANHTLLLSRDGREIPITDSGAPIRHQNGPVTGVVLVFSDQTAERRSEEELRKSEKKFRSVFETTNVGKSLTWISGEVVPNETLCRMLGYSREELAQMKWQDLTPAEDIGLTEKAVKSLITGKKTSERFEKRYIRKDGTTFWADVSTAIMRDDNGAPLHFITTIIDINDRKEAEKRLWALSSRQQAMLAAIPDIIMEVDENKIYTWANQAGYDFFGPDVVGREAEHFFEGEQRTYETVKPLFNGHEDVIYVESWQRRKDGEKRLLGWWCRVLKNSAGNVIGALSSARDITEQKAIEDQIRQSLAEREVMLREIHHRVKNNIQIVSSLLRLQSRRLDNTEAREALTESQNRIRTMALIHEKLYHTGDFSRIDFGDYIESMVTHLLSAYREISGRVTARIEAPGIHLDVNRAIPVGLIVNELITNAIKHAFPGAREGEILVRLIQDNGDHFALTVKDTGIGFPEPVLPEERNTLGLEIIRDLVHQIDGTIDIRNNGGTEILIRF